MLLNSAIGYFCDEQLRLLLQTAPNKYPCDEVHWELWLKVTFRGQPSPCTGYKPQVIDPGPTCRHFRKEHVGLLTKRAARSQSIQRAACTQ